MQSDDEFSVIHPTAYLPEFFNPSEIKTMPRRLEGTKNHKENLFYTTRTKK